VKTLRGLCRGWKPRPRKILGCHTDSEGPRFHRVPGRKNRDPPLQKQRPGISSPTSLRVERSPRYIQILETAAGTWRVRGARAAYARKLRRGELGKPMRQAAGALRSSGQASPRTPRVFLQPAFATRRTPVSLPLSTTGRRMQEFAAPNVDSYKTIPGFFGFEPLGVAKPRERSTMGCAFRLFARRSRAKTNFSRRCANSSHSCDFPLDKKWEESRIGHQVG
jgi:hypothetical protein